MSRPSARAIYIAGNDGTGKTTQARLLVRALSDRGIQTRYVWLRFPQLVSLPVLLISRILRVTKYEVVGDERRGTWHFHKAPWLAGLLMRCQIIDAAVVRHWFVSIPVRQGITVVIDRFVYDIVVDISAATRSFSLLEGRPARRLCGLAPKGVAILLDAPADTIRQRRTDLQHDRSLGLRADMYRRLAKIHSISTVDATASVQDVAAEIARAIEMPPAET